LFVFGVPVVICESADSLQSGQYIPAAAPLLPVPSPPPALATEFFHSVPSLHQSSQYSEDLITGLRESDTCPDSRCCEPILSKYVNLCCEHNATQRATSGCPNNGANGDTDAATPNLAATTSSLPLRSRTSAKAASQSVTPLLGPGAFRDSSLSSNTGH